MQSDGWDLMLVVTGASQSIKQLDQSYNIEDQCMSEKQNEKEEYNCVIKPIKRTIIYFT